MRLARMLCVLVLAIGLPSAVGAQPGREPATAPRRQAAERRFQEGLARIVQARLRLSDDQMRQLVEINRRSARQRQELFGRERDARVGIRSEISKGESADQNRVAALVDELFSIQRQRLDLLQAEQRELARFLSPVQRAQYLELQEQVRRRVQRAAVGGRRSPGWHGRP
jgi:protein CpxP